MEGQLANVPCRNGHELVVRSVATMGRGFQCDSCRVVFQAHQGTETASHCDTCDYDLCRNCAYLATTKLTCNVGHALVPAYPEQLKAENKSYSTGYSCDGNCGTSPSCARYPVRHCPSCRFDLCPVCTARRLGLPVPPSQPPCPPPVTTQPWPPCAQQPVMMHSQLSEMPQPQNMMR